MSIFKRQEIVDPEGVSGEKWPDCRKPSLREMRRAGYRSAYWTCPDCGKRWHYSDTWAGDGWYST